MSVQECLRVINHRLTAKGIPPVTSKDTILKDMTEMANEHFINIESFHDPFDGRIIRYRYEDASFSIYSTSLTEDEVKEIQGALEILSRFDGMPQMEWIRDLCSRFDVSINTADKPVVEFEDSDTVFGREFFTGLYHAIVDKRPIFLDLALSLLTSPRTRPAPTRAPHVPSAFPIPAPKELAMFMANSSSIPAISA